MIGDDKPGQSIREREAALPGMLPSIEPSAARKFVIAIKRIVTIRVRVRVVKGAMDGMLMERDWLNSTLVVIGMIELMMDRVVMVKRQDLVVVLVVRNLVGQSLLNLKSTGKHIGNSGNFTQT